MGYTEMGKLIDRWLADASFRSALRTDPEGTVKTSGMNFSAEEWAVFRTVDWSLTDDQLRERASKFFS